MKRFIKDIAVNDFGDPAKLSLVFIHGFPFSGKMWGEQIAVLQKDYYCVSYDVRGLGDSPPGDGQYSLEGFSDDLLTVIETLQLRQPIAVGLSMGGYIALRAAEKSPAVFGGLVLCDTKAEADDNAGKLSRAQAIATVNRDGLGRYAAYIVPRCFAPDAATKRAKLFKAAIDQVMTQNPTGVKGCLLAMAGRTDTTAFLPKIAVPTLIVVGADDQLTPPAQMEVMRHSIAGAEIAIIEEAGHMSPVENPAAVNRALESFLKSRFTPPHRPSYHP